MILKLRRACIFLCAARCSCTTVALNYYLPHTCCKLLYAWSGSGRNTETAMKSAPITFKCNHEVLKLVMIAWKKTFLNLCIKLYSYKCWIYCFYFILFVFVNVLVRALKISLKWGTLQI